MAFFSTHIKGKKMKYKFSESLKSNYDFQRVYKNGKSYANKYLVMYVLENSKGNNRLGISVSKKVGNSVQRNRARRLMKENYRFLKDSITDGYDLIFIARNTINGMKMPEVGKSMRNAVKRAKLLK